MSSHQTPSLSTAPAKLKSPLPPRHPSSNPLKRKLSVETFPENSLSDFGVKCEMNGCIFLNS
ncbi:hypothetical protein NC651_030678 [Populus alba x Populus x berolinensis]|nr:hypothetical protein NC651_030678 [Populus alba x Populus x berolinensis]